MTSIAPDKLTLLVCYLNFYISTGLGILSAIFSYLVRLTKIKLTKRIANLIVSHLSGWPACWLWSGSCWCWCSSSVITSPTPGSWRSSFTGTGHLPSPSPCSVYSVGLSATTCVLRSSGEIIITKLSLSPCISYCLLSFRAATSETSLSREAMRTVLISMFGASCGLSLSLLLPLLVEIQILWRCWYRPREVSPILFYLLFEMPLVFFFKSVLINAVK